MCEGYGLETDGLCSWALNFICFWSVVLELERPNLDTKLGELAFFFKPLLDGLSASWKTEVTSSGGGGTFLKKSAKLSSWIGFGLEDIVASKSSSSSEESIAYGSRTLRVFRFGIMSSSSNSLL